jgi:NAD(P)-dependent dehydrogenase (short-subunit alcohol dehydrogenase family)
MQNGRLSGKVAIITGGNSGIGRAAACLFAREGARVAIGARNERTGLETVQEIKSAGPAAGPAGGVGDAIFVKTDVADPEQVKNLVEQTMARFGRVDILYGNAGILPAGTAPETSIETWCRTIDINLAGQFYLAKYGIPALITSGGKVIIFTGSELGTVGISSGVACCASKGGVINMTRAVAIDCAPYKIRVNCLCPGPVETPMLRDWINESDDPAKLEQTQTQPVLLKRFGTPQEMAELALFLASDASTYMTGSIVVADGGATAWYGL